MAENSTGDCYLCGARLGKGAMKNHLLKNHGEVPGGQDCCLLKIEGAYDKEYWLYIDVPVEKTLAAIDSFLRKIWLECCGHLSEFADPENIEIGKSRKLKTFAAGTGLCHRYDFGTTTETILTFVGSTTRELRRENVRLLARNAPPVFKCANCGKPAEYIYTPYDEPFEPLFFCEECVDEEDEENGGIFPVSNSPRMGQCAYDGELDTFAFDPTSLVKK